ncbi:YuzD family protein [Radiobacillus kanasensis]|uniref:YuzD family protein n=1 Tax=Radiobacillus kanasensis TaxID=2844358 RepID=UPI001E38A82E|nr:YuzD family protein [Radiobacillus kanasensis]UFT98219.1 YuzD family protein [Radiobacillus kanasensis]
MNPNKSVLVSVYGANQICASCVNAPSSIDTYEWLQAAISRKYEQADVKYEYVDIFDPPKTELHKSIRDQVEEDELFYPVVLVNNKIVADGIPQIKTIYRALEDIGISEL